MHTGRILGGRNTIKEMKEQIVELLESKKKESLYDLRIYNVKREKITNEDSDTIDNGNITTGEGYVVTDRNSLLEKLKRMEE